MRISLKHTLSDPRGWILGVGCNLYIEVELYGHYADAAVSRSNRVSGE